MANSYTTKTAALKATKADIKTIGTKDITITNGVIKFNPEDENLIPANSVTDEAKEYARVAQESAVIAEEGASVASAAASAASISETNAASSATSAAESAAQVEANNEEHQNMLLFWKYYFKRQTDVSNFFANIYNSADMHNSITEFNYPLDNATNTSSMFRYNDTIKSFKTTSLTKVITADKMFHFTPNLKLYNWTYDMPNVTSCKSMFDMYTGNSPIVSFKGNLDKLKDGGGMFLRNLLVVFESSLPSLESGVNMFDRARLNKDSAMRVFNSIPAYTSGTHNLTIGIHVDYQTDEEVLAAIDVATAKGWTVTTQWNGTASTSTFALRPEPAPPIYAKHTPDEDGSYVDANNTRYAVNWGHMVTSPDGKTPLELGYEEFASLENALTTWGLTEYMEIPNEEQNNN